MNRVEFNLLPDVKMDVVKASRTRNTVVSLSLLAAGASLAILLLLAFTVYGVQKKQLSDANKDINDANSQLKSIDGLQRILTVQNQLYKLTTLHASKHATARIFTYLPQVTPTNVSIGGLTVDLAANTMQISGTASSQHAVNVFIDTLKFTKYTSAAGSSQASVLPNAFPKVKESSFAISGNKVTYLLDIQFDPVLFSNNQTAPVLQVPTLTTTRSVLTDPSNLLFNGQSGTKKSGN